MEKNGWARRSASPGAQGWQTSQAAEELGDIAVIGGGIAGLASAYYLSRAGARVTLLEASGELGGLGGAFECRGVHLERFYHCMLPSDDDLLNLLEDLGLADEVYWKETSFGVHAGGHIYPLNRPTDLLRFHALPFRDRLRLGLTGLYARRASADGLDEITCESWLRRLSGPRAFDTFWRPMLEAKFGDRYREVPALWFWTRLNREKGGGVERKGYIHGGYRRIVDTIAESLRRSGQTVRLRSPVEALGLDERGKPQVRVHGEDWQGFDRLLFAAPFSLFRRAAERGRLVAAAAGAAQDVDMVGVVNVVLVCRRPLTPHYWVAVPDADIPFQGIVETTNLIDTSDSGGMHLLHLLRYTHRDDPLFGVTDEEVLEAYLPALRRLFPGIALTDDSERFVFRAPFVEPLYSRGFLERQPPMEVVPGAVYLATTAQVYPQVTSWNGSVGLVRKVVDLILSQREVM
jgi:protoporphyrinogen oxidase